MEYINSLMMVSQGASNNTYDEILKTLNLNQDQLNYFTNHYNPIDSVLLVLTVFGFKEIIVIILTLHI